MSAEHSQPRVSCRIVSSVATVVDVVFDAWITQLYSLCCFNLKKNGEQIICVLT